jgi:glycosyltransferase involved in cell wall biosynthesis
MLLDRLKTHTDKNSPRDEIVVLDDFSNNPETIKVLNKAKQFGITVVQHALGGNFGEHKNYGSKRCVKTFVCQLDADEYLSQSLLENIHEIIESNPTVELYRLPRVNIVRGATDNDARKWGWHMMKLPEFGDLPIINWGNGGDYQSRIYKNSLRIQWHKPLHETIVGASIVAHLPKEVDYAIIHDKTIERQTQQNIRYNTEWSEKENRGIG